MIEAFCVVCGRDCTNCNATYEGDIHCLGCLPRRRSLKAGHAAAKKLFQDVELDPRIAAARDKQ